MKLFLCRIPLLLAGFLALLTPAVLHAQREKFTAEQLDYIEQRWPDSKRTFTGLRYVVLKEGDKNGGMPQPGMMVSTLYKGMLFDGTVFDQALDPKKPFKTRIGRDQLIRGWEEALQKMHRGDRWLLIVPFELAYGTSGRPPSIPREAPLVFEMELLDFER